ncbi:MAG: phage terminase large subunit [Polyangiaceae bacterium]|nr:phage terminase large subunit [Polyangiaceae bacterium]
MTTWASLCKFALSEIERGYDEAAEDAPRAKTLPKWTPQPGPQEEFFHSDVDEILYGGAAGGGKSMGAVALPLPWIHHRDLRVLILRRESTQLSSLVDDAKKVYKHGDENSARPYVPAEPGVQFVSSPHWEARFPSGALINFGHCQGTDDWEQYQGRAWQIIVFDELTHFLEKQYLEISSRCRSGSRGLPRKIRATSNPGSRGHEWVFKRWRWWLDPQATIPGRAPRYAEDGKTLLPPALPGEVLWIKKDLVTDEEVICDGPEFDEDGEQIAMSRSFIPARLKDNQALIANDPGYRAKLRNFSKVRREQLESGNWLIRPAAGLYFKRHYFEIVDAAPAEVIARVRFWDRAGSTRPGADWTIGVRLSLATNMVGYVEHVARLRGTPGEVERAIRNIATHDQCPEFTTLFLEQDPAQAGLSEKHHLGLKLAEFAPRWVPPEGSKEVRAEPASAQAEAGNIKLVRGAWNDPFLNVLEDFPDGDFDDDVDGLSGAYNRALEIAKRWKPSKSRVRVLGAHE